MNKYNICKYFWPEVRVEMKRTSSFNLQYFPGLRLLYFLRAFYKFFSSLWYWFSLFFCFDFRIEYELEWSIFYKHNILKMDRNIWKIQRCTSSLFSWATITHDHFPKKWATTTHIREFLFSKNMSHDHSRSLTYMEKFMV